MSRVSSKTSNWRRVSRFAFFTSLLLAVALIVLPQPSRAQGMVVVPASVNQLAAPGDDAPLPLTLQNLNSGSSQTMLWFIQADTTGGAILSGAGDLDSNAPDGDKWGLIVPPSGQAGPTLTLGPSQGSVTVHTCDAVFVPPSTVNCSTVSTPRFFAKTGTIAAVSPVAAFVDRGDDITTEAQGFNGGVVDATQVPIAFSIVGPGIALSPANTTSDNNAPASFLIRIDPAAPAGSIVTVTATRTDVPSAPAAVFVYTVNDYLLTQVSPPDGTTAQAGAVVPLVVELRRNGVPEPAVNISWAFSPVPNNGSLLTSSTTPTVGDGTASNNLTVGQPNPGSPPPNIVVTATVFAGNVALQQVVDFVIAPRDVIVLGTPTGDGQSAPINTAFAVPLGIVSTRNGQPDSGSTINWTVSPAGAATLASQTLTAAGSGSTSNTVTAGSTGGTFTVTATHADDPTVVHTFTLTAVDQRLIKPSTGSGDGQIGGPNQVLAQPLVAVATLNGATEAGVPVSWTVTGGTATITGSTSPTDANGRSTAQVTLGSTPGTVTVQAERTDKLGEIQIYTLTVSNAPTLEKPPTGSGDGQLVERGQTSQPLIVIAKNAGVPTGGVVVLWSVTGDATLNTNQTTTIGDGSTSVEVRFGANADTVTVTATRQDAPAATASFVLTANEPDLTLELAPDSGDGTRAPSGTPVTLRALARRNGSPEANVSVFFEVVSGNAQLSRTAAATNVSGIAATVATLGRPGPIQVRATRTDRSGASVLFNLTSTATGETEELTIVEGNGQAGLPGSVGTPLKVRYARNGVVTSGVPVAWSVVSGSASLASASTTTAADGTTQVGITFAQTPGPVSVRAEAGSAFVVFALSVRSSDTGGLNLRLVSGAGQIGLIGARADQPIVLEVTNSAGQPVSAQAIEWEVASGSATLDAPVTSTGTDGRSSQGFRFGTIAGPIVLRAKLPGPTINALEIHATSVVPSLTIVSGNNQSGPVSTPLPLDFVVAIAAPPSTTATLAGIAIQWQVVEGNGTLSSATSLTSADGRASNRLALGPSTGTHRVTASLAGGGSVTFTATAQANAAPLIIVSGNNQTLPTQSDSAPLVVELKSTAGVPIQGASLLWTGDNAELRSARTSTDAQGRASNIAQVLMPGAARVTVRVEGTNTGNNSVAFVINGGVANILQLSPPDQAIGRAIDQLCPALLATANRTSDQADLLARCLELVNNAGDHPDQVENALQQMRQDVALAQANAALVTAATQFDNLKARIAALRSGRNGADLGGLAVATSTGVVSLSFLPSSAVEGEDETEGGSEAEIGADFSRWGFFASGIIGRGEHEAGSTTPEYDFDTNGITAGVDYRINDQWFAGVSLGYNQQDTELSADRGGIDTKGWSISGYTSWFRENNWYLDGVLTFGSNDYDLSRRIVYDIVAAGGGLTHVDQLAEASTGGDQLSAALSVGRDFQTGAWTYGPYLRGTYTRVEFDAYREQLESGTGSGLGLEVDARELKSMTGVLGGKVTYAMSRDWGILMPHAQLEWEHEFKDDPQQLVTRFLNDPTATAIRMDGDALDSEYYNIGFGVSALFPGGRSAFLYYEHLAGSEGLSQDNLSVGVRIEF